MTWATVRKTQATMLFYRVHSVKATRRGTRAKGAKSRQGQRQKQGAQEVEALCCKLGAAKVA